MLSNDISQLKYSPAPHAQHAEKQNPSTAKRKREGPIAEGDGCVRAPAQKNTHARNELTCQATTIYVLVLFATSPPPRKPNQLPFIPPSRLTPEAAARRARDIDRLESLTEIAWQLAERAGARALAVPIVPEPEPQIQPGAKPAPARPDPEIAFNRLARTVKDLITIKSRLDAGLVPDAPAPEPQEGDDRPSSEWQTLTDPRRPLIIRTVNEAIKTSPHPVSEHAALKRTVENRTLKFLAADPGQTLAPAIAIIGICNDLKLPYDPNKFADELILPPGDHRLKAQPEDPPDDLSAISGVYHPP